MRIKGLKILFFHFEQIKINDIVWGLLEQEADVEFSSVLPNENIIIEDQVTHICNELKNYDYAFSQDFSVNIAEACHIMKIPYISWIYDSPQIALHTDYALYNENYIFSFDKMQVQRLKQLGVAHCYYQPLAANTRFIETLKFTVEDCSKYKTDVSFVGQLYQNERINNFLLSIQDEEKNIFARFCSLFTCHWGEEYNLFDNKYDTIIEPSLKHIVDSDLQYYHFDPLYIARCLWHATFISFYDRVELLKALSENFTSTLYTTDKDVEYAKSFFKGTVNGKIPREETYKVFYSSKLNLNTTLRTIESGIPLRIFDIMSVGGVVLTNYQSEIDELFSPNKDILVFHSKEEMLDLATYYINRDASRQKIADNAKRRIDKDFTFEKALNEIFSKL